MNLDHLDSLNDFLKKAREAKLSTTNLEALCYTYQSKRTITDIARKVGVSAANGTGMVDTLERLGYVHRHSSPDDRRKIEVEITALGLTTLTSLMECLPKITVVQGSCNP